MNQFASGNVQRLLAVAAVGVAFGFQATPSEPFDRERETYKIYSRLMSPPETSHGPDDNPRYLITGKSRVESWHPAPANCVRPPGSHEARFRELLSDFEGKRKSARTLERKLSPGKPYELLSDASAGEFQKERMPRPPGQEQPSEQFRDVSDLFTLTDVYFSKDGKLALAGLGSWCGGLCARFSWRVFEKSEGGEWIELRWPICIVMAGTAPSVLVVSASASGQRR